MKIWDKLKILFYINDPAWKIALTFSIGLFIGMSPLIGFHTILALAVAFIFRLNKLVILVAVYFTNPWTIVPIYTFSTLIGAKILGRKINITIDWSHITLSDLIHNMGSLLLPFVTGTIIVGFVLSVLSYIVIYAILSKKSRAPE